jgi:succinoglycan biosynthesis transport protein ExoP
MVTDQANENNQPPNLVTPSNPADPQTNLQVMGPTVELRPAHSPITALRLLTFLLKYWWIPSLTTMLGMGAAVAYLHWARSSFVSSASMWETEKLRLPDGGLFAGDMQNYLGTQIELLKSGELAQLAMQRLKDSGANAVPTNADGSMIQPQISVAQVPKSTILVVQAASTDGVFSQSYLNALLDAYLDFKKNLKKSMSDYTLASMSEHVSHLELELKTEQNALTAFERTNNLAILQEEGNISGAYLAKLDTQLSDSQLELKLLEANEAERGGADSNTLTPNGLARQGAESSGAAGDSPRSAARELAMLRIERESLSRFLRPKHPKIVKLDADIERAQKLNEVFRQESQKQLEDSRKVLQSRIEGLQAAVHEWEAKVMNANSGIAEAERLKLNVNRVQAGYDRWLGLLQNIDINRSMDQETLAVLSPASPAWRSRKKEQQQATTAIFGGLFLGVGIILLISWRDDRLTSLSEMNEKFGDVIVGQVPELPCPNGERAKPLLQAEDDRKMYAESYRNLRSALLFMPVSVERPKVMLVTSAMPNEGKSTIASNLARTLALGGSRVVLIDADLRRGYLHELLGMNQEPGLADALQHPKDLGRILQSNCMPNLSFISRGCNLSRPGDLFVGPAFDLLLVELRHQFDHVIIDTSPVFAADDVTTLAPRVDGTLFVVRTGISRSGPVGEALELLVRRQAKILGIVINGTNAASKSYYYYKNSEYYEPFGGNTGKLPGKQGEPASLV